MYIKKFPGGYTDEESDLMKLFQRYKYPRGNEWFYLTPEIEDFLKEIEPLSTIEELRKLIKSKLNKLERNINKEDIKFIKDKAKTSILSLNEASYLDVYNLAGDDIVLYFHIKFLLRWKRYSHIKTIGDFLTFHRENFVRNGLTIENINNMYEALGIPVDIRLFIQDLQNSELDNQFKELLKRVSTNIDNYKKFEKDIRIEKEFDNYRREFTPSPSSIPYNPKNYEIQIPKKEEKENKLLSNPVSKFILLTLMKVEDLFPKRGDKIWKDGEELNNKLREIIRYEILEKLDYYPESPKELFNLLQRICKNKQQFRKFNSEFSQLDYFVRYVGDGSGSEQILSRDIDKLINDLYFYLYIDNNGLIVPTKTNKVILNLLSQLATKVNNCGNENVPWPCADEYKGRRLKMSIRKEVLKYVYGPWENKFISLLEELPADMRWKYRGIHKAQSPKAVKLGKAKDLLKTKYANYSDLIRDDIIKYIIDAKKRYENVYQISEHCKISYRLVEELIRLL